MSDILSEIDDTLADWHGSADSMHWRPDIGDRLDEPTVGPPFAEAAMRAIYLSETTMPILRMADNFQFMMRQLATSPGISRGEVDAAAEGLRMLEPFTLEMEIPFPEPSPELSYWEAAAMRRTIAGMFAIAPRDLGLPPRYGFDARYWQRQKNRRKRRR